MQLDELQHRWQQLEQKLDKTMALGSEVLRQQIVQPVRSRINRQSFWPILDIIFCLLLLWPIGSIMYHYGRQSSVLFPAIIAMASTLALLISSIYLLHLTADIKWDGPVVAIQTRLEKLRVARISQFKWIILLAPLAGFSGMLSLGHGLIAWLSDNRANLIEKLPQPWVMMNYVFDILFLLLGHLLAGYLSRKFEHHRWWQHVLDDISGKTLTKATADLKKWEAFTG